MIIVEDQPVKSARLGTPVRVPVVPPVVPVPLLHGTQFYKLIVLTKDGTAGHARLLTYS